MSGKVPIYLPDQSAIYRGDAFKLIKLVRPESVRLVLTDPPYNVSQENNLTSMGRRGIEFGEWDHEFDVTGWLEDAVKTLVPGGSIIVWSDWKLLGLISARLKELGVTVKRQLKWVKTNPMPRNLLRVPVQDEECAAWGVKGKGWVFHRRPSVTYERGKFFHPVIRKSPHPTKKPDKVFQDIIRIFSDPGDLILDPFLGSGTTACAAQRTRRRHISFELDEKYFELAVGELAKITSVTHIRSQHV